MWQLTRPCCHYRDFPQFHPAKPHTRTTTSRSSVSLAKNATRGINVYTHTPQDPFNPYHHHTHVRYIILYYVK